MNTVGLTYYKVKYLKQHNVECVFVFLGRDIDTEDEEDEKNVFNQVFDDEERHVILKYEIPVRYCPFLLHYDDTIFTIKMKILGEFQKMRQVSMEEMYLFYNTKHTMNVDVFYDALREKDSSVVSGQLLNIAMQNIVKIKRDNKYVVWNKKITNLGDTFGYDDVLSLGIANQTLVMNSVLGLQYEVSNMMVVNPYKVKTNGDYVATGVTLGSDSLLMLNSGYIHKKTIYVCLANDVMMNSNTEGLDTSLAIRTYYPSLYNREITTMDELSGIREKLVYDNKTFLNKSTEELFRKVQMLYDIYYTRKSDLSYISAGVRYLKFSLVPDLMVKIPLNIIFKLFHATEEYPLIKYNPTLRQENIYRLYTDSVAKNGGKIPYLKRNMVFKLIKTIGKQRSISIYIPEPETQYGVIFEIYETGHIMVYCEFKELKMIMQITVMLKRLLVPLIDKLNAMFEINGYHVNTFVNLETRNITIVDINYETNIRSRPLTIDQYKGCLYSVFNNETNKYTSVNETALRYKRVSNYNNVLRQEAFVIEKLRQHYSKTDIYNELMENFKHELGSQDARQLVEDISSREKLQQYDNPGFKTTLYFDRLTTTVKINVELIDNLKYLRVIPIYIDTMIRLSREPDTVSISMGSIREVCSDNTRQIQNYINEFLEHQRHQQLVKIKEEDEKDNTIMNEINEQKANKMLNLFMDDDEDEEEDEDDLMHGGAEPANPGEPEAEPETEPDVVDPVVGANLKRVDDSPPADPNDPVPVVVGANLKREDDGNMMGDAVEEFKAKVIEEKKAEEVVKEKEETKVVDYAGLLMDKLEVLRKKKDDVAGAVVPFVINNFGNLNNGRRARGDVFIMEKDPDLITIKRQQVEMSKKLHDIGEKRAPTEDDQRRVREMLPRINAEVLPNSIDLNRRKMQRLNRARENIGESIEKLKRNHNMFGENEKREVIQLSSNLRTFTKLKMEGIENRNARVTNNKAISSIQKLLSTIKMSPSEKKVSESKTKLVSLLKQQNVLRDIDAVKNDMIGFIRSKLQAPPTEGVKIHAFKDSEGEVPESIHTPAPAPGSLNSIQKMILTNFSRGRDRGSSSGSDRELESLKQEDDSVSDLLKSINIEINLLDDRSARTPYRYAYEEGEGTENADNGLKIDDMSEDDYMHGDDEYIEKQLNGYPLNKPYYFQREMEKKEPTLILKKETDGFNVYSRTCSSDSRRQPVIITDNQLKTINSEHKGFLKTEDVITYGTNPEKKYHYICPRFWCLKTKSVIDPSELKEVVNEKGEKELVHPTCGKVLPRDAKKVKPGYYIYEFYGANEKRYPGFQTGKHPDGYCLPCCFEKYNTMGRIAARNVCMPDENEKKEDSEEGSTSKETQSSMFGDVEGEKDKPPMENTYIIEPDKYPINIGRWGYLPIELQIMLKQSNIECQVSKSSNQLKQNYTCLMRHGVEFSTTQSFIACMSDLMFFAETENDTIKTIAEFKKYMMSILTINIFIRLQNGNLVNIFYNKDKSPPSSFCNAEMSKLEMNNPAYRERVCNAYYYFLVYLKDDTVVIDHTYLWDFVCMPNPKLMVTGFNLFIFNIPRDDVTNNIQMVCPSNHYSSAFYDSRKPTVVLVKQGSYYEPVYGYNMTSRGILITKTFREHDIANTNIQPLVKNLIRNIIKPFYTQTCSPKPSMPKQYLYKSALDLPKMLRLLHKNGFEVDKLVMNFDNKVIGIMVSGEADKSFYLPCFPSGLEADYETVFMTDVGLWNTYESTVRFLERVSGKTNAHIPCSPLMNVVEEGLLVGLLTETNQFIQISDPMPLFEIQSELPVIYDNNYMLKNGDTNEFVQSDIVISGKMERNGKYVDDVARVDYVKRVHMETEFYSMFQNTVRLLMNKNDNLVLKTEIMDELKKDYITYTTKLNNIDSMLKKLVGNHIQFSGDDEYYKSPIKRRDVLVLPMHNLLTGTENSDIYFKKMADEIVRFMRIQSFIFDKRKFLSFGDVVDYQVNSDEVIMIQSFITTEYFESLIPRDVNAYAMNTTFDTASPSASVGYDNTVIIKNYMHEHASTPNEEVCNLSAPHKITGDNWGEYFSSSFYYVEYPETSVCSYQLIIDIVERRLNKQKTIQEIKNKLAREYKRYIYEFRSVILKILEDEGKGDFASLLQHEKINIDDMVSSSKYVLTMFDVLLLMAGYDIATVFLRRDAGEVRILVGYFNPSVRDYSGDIVYIGVAETGSPKPAFQLVQYESGEIDIPLKIINKSRRKDIREELKTYIPIYKYLQMLSKKQKLNRRIQKRVIQP